MKLRNLEENDFKTLISWVDNAQDLMLFAGSAYSFPLDEKQLLATLNDSKIECFSMLNDQNEMVGHCQLFLLEKSVKIARVIINPAYRGQSFGRILMELLLNYIQQFYSTFLIELYVFDFNTRAISLYESLGFERQEIGEKLTVVNGQTWRAIKMIKPSFAENLS